MRLPFRGSLLSAALLCALSAAGQAQTPTATMRTVSNISIPAHATVRFSPDSPHLLLTGTRPLHGGTQLTLTLAFAKGGTMSVVAVVTNPATGGSSYFIN